MKDIQLVRWRVRGTLRNSQTTLAIHVHFITAAVFSVIMWRLSIFNSRRRQSEGVVVRSHEFVSLRAIVLGQFARVAELPSRRALRSANTSHSPTVPPLVTVNVTCLCDKQMWRLNALECWGKYGATPNNIMLVINWPLTGERGGAWAGCGPAEA